MNIDHFLACFDGKTREEAEQVAKELVEGCERKGQAKIAYSALDFKYGEDEKREVEDKTDFNKKIVLEREKGATKAFLRKKYDLKAAELDKILKSKNVKKEKLTIEPKIEKKDLSVSELENLMS